MPPTSTSVQPDTIVAADLPRLVVVTALPVECKAVCAHLSNRFEHVDSDGTVYECGEFIGARTAWRVAVVESGPGNHPAAEMVTRAVHEFAPDVLLFVGIAGSLRSDGVLGSVVAARKVYGYQGGRTKDGRLNARPELEYTNYALEQRARATVRQEKWIDRIQDRSTSLPKPIAEVSVIAAGEIVQGDDTVEIYELVRHHYNDAIAVEMEGYGTLRAARRSGISAMVVRGISDRVKDKEICDSDGWQKIASANAAAFAFEMIANFDPGFQSRSRSNFPRPSDGAPIRPQGETSTSDLGSSPALPAPKIDQIRSKLQQLARPLVEMTSPLGLGKWLNRPELRQLEDFVRGEQSGLLVLLGGPGSGKSSILSRLAIDCAKDGIAVFAIKADMLPANVDSIEKLSAHLGLDAGILETVNALSAEGRLVVIVDQLDALAELVDLKSGRLNVLLEFISRIRMLRNVRLICSCREFEYHHDTRLASLDASKIDLTPPVWSEVTALLKEKNVEGELWPENFRNLLLTPQYLKVFLDRLQDSGESGVVESYTELLEDLWARKILHNPDSRDLIILLDDIAEFLAAEEILWAPAARFQGRERHIDYLVGAGILARTSGVRQLGFAHQTLFEHARARAFAAGKEHLANYVLARQDSLFVRPTLWAALRYLRDAAPAEHERQFGELFNRGPRPHLRYLLIDFIGQVRSPRPFEIAIYGKMLSDGGMRRRAIIAIQGNEDWFNALLSSQIPAVMLWEHDESWPVTVLLQRAFEFDRENVLRLIRKYWLPDSSRDDLTLNVLRENTVWEAEVVNDICHIIARQDIAEWFVSDVVGKISAATPELAPRVVSTWFQRRLRTLDASGPDFEKIDRLLTKTQGWYDLPAIAEAAPREFIRANWEWIVRVLERLMRSPNDAILAYRISTSLAVDFGVEQVARYPVMESIYAAMVAFAKQNPEDFIKFVQENKHIDAEIVQRLFTIGLTQLAETHTRYCIDFMTEDARRLMLGGRRHRYRDTKALLSAVGARAEPGDIRILEDAILRWSFYKPDSSIELDDETIKWREDRNNHNRALMLSRLPAEKRSKKAEDVVRQFPDLEHDDDVPRIGEGLPRIDSPMSSSEMEAVSDSEIHKLFDILVDSTEAHHPHNWELGGSVQASREFAQLAERQPERVMRMLPTFRPGDQEQPVVYALPVLAKAGIPAAKIREAVLELVRLGFKSDDFRESAAEALEIQVHENDPLPDEHIRLLIQWLGEPWASVPPAESVAGNETEHRLESVLWGQGGFMVLPHGRYRVLHTLATALLLKRPPGYDKFIAILSEHLERGESPEVWKAMYEQLRWLGKCNPDELAKFVSRLYEVPGFLESTEGIRLLATLWSKLPTAWLRQTVHNLRNKVAKYGPQAYGELVAFAALTREASVTSWVHEELQKQLTASPESEASQQTRLGIAFSVTELWAEPKTRAFANQILIQLIPFADDDTARAIVWLFALNEDMPADAITEKLLAQIAANPKLLKVNGLDYVIQRLEELLPSFPNLVVDICRAIIETRGREIIDIQRELGMSGPTLVNISLTLQRLGGEFRAKGLGIFEQLLELGLLEAQSAMNELDLRPINVSRRERPRRRRQPKRQAPK